MNDKRDPESIRRKKRRRSPEEIEYIRRKRELERRGNGEPPRRKRSPEEIEAIRRRRERERISSEPNSSRDRQKTKKKMSTKKKILLGVLAIICIILIYITSIMVSFFSKVEIDDSVAAVAPKSGESVNILVLGMDIGDVNNTENTSIKRTDTMMLINYNPESGKTQVISIPRDTLVTIDGTNMKMNAVYQNGGNKRVKSVVEDMLEVTVNYMINIDYTAFRGFIDAIGGVDMYIERDMIYDDPAQDLHINFKKGETVHLDGKLAENFFRWRKNNDGTGFAMGDLDRIENQHKLLQQVAKKCKSPSILFKASSILDVVASNMTTNMSAWNIIYYGIKEMFSLGNGVNMTTITTTPKYINGISYVIYDKSDNQELMESLNSSSIVSNEEIDIKKANVLVLNGTNTNGLAANTKSELIAAGLNNVETGNETLTKKTVILSNYPELKKELSNVLDISNTKNKQTDYHSDYDAVIILGSDYDK